MQNCFSQSSICHSNVHPLTLSATVGSSYYFSISLDVASHFFSFVIMILFSVLVTNLTLIRKARAVFADGFKFCLPGWVTGTFEGLSLDLSPKARNLMPLSDDLESVHSSFLPRPRSDSGVVGCFSATRRRGGEQVTSLFCSLSLHHFWEMSHI